MNNSTTTAAKKLLSLALDKPIDLINDDAAIGTTPAWDSLGHMKLILMMEESLQIELAPDQILSIRDLDSIARLISSK